MEYAFFFFVRLAVVIQTSVIDRMLRKSIVFLFPSAYLLHNLFSLIIDETCEYDKRVNPLIQ